LWKISFVKKCGGSDLPKILIIGGSPNSLLNFRGDLIRDWVKMNFDVVATAAPAKDIIVAKIEAMGVVFKSIPIKNDSLNLFNDIIVLLSINRIIKQEKPSHIFSYTAKPVIYSVISSYLNRNIKYFPMVTGVGYVFSGSSLKQNILRIIMKYLYRIAFKKSQVIFFQNIDDLKLFKEHHIIGESSKTVIVNGSGVNIDYFSYKKPIVNNVVRFLFMGRLLKSKGILIYIKAAKLLKEKYNEVEFVILGAPVNSPDSIKEGELRIWSNSGLVKHKGWKDDVRSEIAACDVFVLPTSYGEGVPRSILEAMSMGRPVITTDTPGCRETVENGVNGYLVPVRDSEALAAAMERFIDQPELIEKMGLESRRIAKEKFDVHKVNRVILDAMKMGETDSY